MKVNKKILIVDDDLGVLEALRVALESEEIYDIETTANASDVPKLTKKLNPDLILLDILLSGADGRDICSDLKKNEATRSIPIVIVSAHPTSGKSLKECGADEFISKPFDLDTLLSTVKKFVSQN